MTPEEKVNTLTTIWEAVGAYLSNSCGERLWPMARIDGHILDGSKGPRLTVILSAPDVCTEGEDGSPTEDERDSLEEDCRAHGIEPADGAPYLLADRRLGYIPECFNIRLIDGWEDYLAPGPPAPPIVVIQYLFHGGEDCAAYRAVVGTSLDGIISAIGELLTEAAETHGPKPER